MAEKRRGSAVSFRCDLRGPPTPLPHFWEHTVGSGYAPLTLRADWQTQLYACRGDLGFRHVRFHGLLSDDLYTLTRNAGELDYCFFNIDRIFDFLLSIGMRPFVELSFMPTAIASGEQTVFAYRANVTPPTDQEAWRELIRRLIVHLVDRYGTEELRHWYFEVWNEPNQPEFWSGTQEDYFALYRTTAETIKAIDSQFRVGGPATSKNAWIEAFLGDCARRGTPVDFVSTHHYPDDRRVASSSSECQVAGNASDAGALEQQDRRNRARAGGVPVLVTEWNCAAEAGAELHDEPYAAAFIIKTVLETAGQVECYSFWTFSDIFAERGFPTKPFHGGFGLVNLYGVPKPSYRAFRLLHQLGEEKLLVEGTHETARAWVVRKPRSATALLVNHSPPEVPIETVAVELVLDSCPAPHRVQMERIDEQHAHAKRAWQAMGEPEYLVPQQVGQLQIASQLVRETCPWQRAGERLLLQIELPPQSVAAVTLEFAQDEHHAEP